MTRIGRLFAFAFALYGVVCALYAWTQDRPAGRFWSLILVIGGVGVTLVGDWLSLYLFWESLAIASVFLIWQGRDPDSQGAGLRYVIFHVIGGVCLLGGVLWQIQIGQPMIQPLNLADGLGAWLILIGMAVNAAVVPLHAWLPDAYPRASIFGTVFLAAFTTKAAVYTLARTFPGEEILMWAGTIMAVYGVYYALLENHIRRLLGYHIVSQVGYMVCGVGIGTAIAIDGSSAHAFCHIFYKGLLMMSAGAVLHVTGRQRLSELGQLAGSMKWTFLMMMIGAFSIAGVPLFNGFVSKSMVTAAAGEDKQGLVYLLLYLASMGTFLSIALKLAWFTFFGVDHGAKVERPLPWSMGLAMGLVAAVCLFTGLPGGYHLLYRNLPTPVIAQADPHAHGHDDSQSHDKHDSAHRDTAHTDTAHHAELAPANHATSSAGQVSVYYRPYTAEHLLQTLQLLVGTTLGFWLLRRALVGKPMVSLDVDRLYRRPLGLAVATGSVVFERSFGMAEQAVQATARAVSRIPERIAAVVCLPMGYRVALIVGALVFLWCISWILRPANWSTAEAPTQPADVSIVSVLDESPTTLVDR
jgi:formate hydrogenlyase subunit 3/multisubunit Na+/H+ antiporter MnhD subunit